MRSFIRNIHLYLSLAAGLVIWILCFTGAALVFEKELLSFFYKERYFVTPGPARVPFGLMEKKLKEAVPEAQVSTVKIYNDPARTVELLYSEIPDRAGKKEAAARFYSAFMDPYTGAVVSLHTQRSRFFTTMLSLHRTLLMTSTGKTIVGISTLIFLAILFTGLLLWWPAGKKTWKQRLSIRWTAGWKRLSHDLHIVTGFYTSIFLLTFAFTGLTWSFRWFSDGVSWLTGTEYQKTDPPRSGYSPGLKALTLDQSYMKVKYLVSDCDYYIIRKPADSLSPVSVICSPSDAPHERATDQLYLDQYTGELLARVSYADKSTGQQIRSAFYPLHVGSAAGLPGKIIAFLCCLAGMTFPITGLILWINRRRKRSRSDK